MTKFWLMTKSTTAALCLLGIGANTALGMEALARENDLQDLDECETFDALAEEAIATDSNHLSCSSSVLEETETEDEALTSSDPVEFEDFADPAWQEENTQWDAAAEPLPLETEAEWENVPDAATEEWHSPVTLEKLEAEWEAAADVSEELEAIAPTEAAMEWENVPDAALEEWDSPVAIEEIEAIPDIPSEEKIAPIPAETVADEWANVPDAALEDWDERIVWENVPDLSATESIQLAIATETHGKNRESDRSLQVAIESEGTKAEGKKPSRENLIQDDRELSELIAPTLEQHRARTTGLPPEQIVSAAENNSLPEIATLESVPETPLLDLLDADLRRLRQQAEIVASQSLNSPIFTPQPIAFDTYGFNFNDDYGAISASELEQWVAQFEEEFSLEDESAFETSIDVNAIANSIDLQLFEQDLSELGLEIFDTTLFEGDSLANSLLFNSISFDAETFGTLEIDFDSVLASWENALGDANLTRDLTAFIPSHLLTSSSLSFIAEMPDLNWQGEDIFAIESAFEKLPELDFGTHPFEFGFKRDLLRASLPLASKSSI